MILKNAHIMHIMIWIMISNRMYMLVALSNFDSFALELTEFIIILVSCPVNTTIPYIQSVFLREEPRRRI